MAAARSFDESYYRRYYEDPKTRVYSAVEHDHLASYVFAFARWNQIEIDNVLDVGAGIGLWRDWIQKHQPKLRYTGTEVSEAMCKKHGFKQADIASWRDRKKYDLIICQGVLQYISDDGIESAVANIAAMARGLVFFEALTRGDFRERADQARTDSDVFLRPGSFYRSLFGQHFVTVGAGLYWPSTLELPFWELDVGGIR
ncbi:MAG TPA: methyltransferase [Polyangiaceae bacterium]|jgi:2-polyprenyl-3-methyl-5-hydroxy-6-metoxy-1,4-benzoquinol methylase|nr:methyltransferase [Polyangiaceae bacterium]